MKINLTILTICGLIIPQILRAATPQLTIATNYQHENYTYNHITQVSSMSLAITATDADNTIPNLSAANLPTGASFVDNNDGTGTFSWAPSSGQVGYYYPRFIAFDGSTSDVDTAEILVNAYPLSHGFYRIGYANGTTVKCSNDHLTHTPILKLDLIGTPQFDGGGNSIDYQIVSSAQGEVQEIIDDNSRCCNTNCSGCNNHVRIKHANGEWTKYTHFEQFTVTSPSFADLDTFVCYPRGTYLGEEGDVGHTSGNIASSNRFQNQSCNTAALDTTKKCGIHLHFEVRMNGPGSGLRIPLFCDVPGFVWYENSVYTAGSCVASCGSIVLPNSNTYDGNDIEVFQADSRIDTDNAANFIVEGTASVAFSAGDRITLKPGFHAKKFSYFHAWIGPCDGSPTGCPSK